MYEGLGCVLDSEFGWRPRDIFGSLVKFRVQEVALRTWRRVGHTLSRMFTRPPSGKGRSMLTSCAGSAPGGFLA